MTQSFRNHSWPFSQGDLLCPAAQNSHSWLISCLPALSCPIEGRWTVKVLQGLAGLAPPLPGFPVAFAVLPQGNPFSIIENPDRPVLTPPPHLPETPHKFVADPTRTQISSVLMGLWADASILKISFPVCVTQRQGGANMQTPCNGLEKENKYLEPGRRMREGQCRHSDYSSFQFTLLQAAFHPQSQLSFPTQLLPRHSLHKNLPAPATKKIHFLSCIPASLAHLKTRLLDTVRIQFWLLSLLSLSPQFIFIHFVPFFLPCFLRSKYFCHCSFLWNKAGSLDHKCFSHPA